MKDKILETSKKELNQTLNLLETSLKPLMGQYISQFYPDFFVIGTGFNQGKVGLTGSSIVEVAYQNAIYDSYDFLFSQCKYPFYFLDFDLVKESTPSQIIHAFKIH